MRLALALVAALALTGCTHSDPEPPRPAQSKVDAGWMILTSRYCGGVADGLVLRVEEPVDMHCLASHFDIPADVQSRMGKVGELQEASWDGYSAQWTRNDTGLHLIVTAKGK